MGWDAALFLPADLIGSSQDHWVKDWSYTYNVYEMTRVAAEACGIRYDGMARFLNGKTAAETALPLAAIADELEANRAKYDAMNPENGWGSRYGIATVLHEMAQWAADYPKAFWEAS